MEEIDRIITIEPSGMDISSLLRLSEELRRYNFTVSINVSEKMIAYIIPFLAFIPVRIGFWPGLSQPFKSVMCLPLLTEKVIYHNDPAKAMGEHEVERQSRLLLPLGINPEKKPLYLKINENDDSWASSFIESKEPDRNLIAIHLSSKWMSDSWNESVLKRLIERILSVYDNYKCLVTYGEPDRQWAERLLEETGNERIIPFYDPSFKRWAAVIRFAQALITMDTSASHVSSAVGVPVVDVFPDRYYTHCTERWHPWMVDYRIVEKKTLESVSDNVDRNEIEGQLIDKILTGLGELLKCRK